MRTAERLPGGVDNPDEFWKFLVDGGNGYIIVQGQDSGFVRHLYAGGAWLVLPVIAGGCSGRVPL